MGLVRCIGVKNNFIGENGGKGNSVEKEKFGKMANSSAKEYLKKEN